MDEQELERVRETLQSWVREKMPTADHVAIPSLTEPDGTGFSSETLLFRLDVRLDDVDLDHELVLRMRPSGVTVFPDYDLEAQIGILRELEDGSGVPVPKVWWYEPDTSVLDSPFYVMTKVDGEIPSDTPPLAQEGWLHDATPAQQRLAWESSIDVLARLHSLDPEPFGFLDEPEYGPTGLGQRLEHDREYLAWAAEGEPQPILEQALVWLDERRPAEESPSVVLWGDARLSNIVFQGFQPAALLDWEMAALGPPEKDLGWFTYMDEILSVGIDLPRLPGFPSKQETVERYEAATGRPVRDLEFFEIWAGFTFGITMLRIAIQLREMGIDVGDGTTNNLATRRLATLLDLESPGEPGLLG